MHVDHFIYDHEEFGRYAYARWFFLLHRLPAALKADFDPWIKAYRLFCTYEGATYRVTGASRLGDVWLATDFNRETGYDLRVDVEECSAWRDRPIWKN